MAMKFLLLLLMKSFLSSYKIGKPLFIKHTFNVGNVKQYHSSFRCIRMIQSSQRVGNGIKHHKHSFSCIKMIEISENVVLKHNSSVDFLKPKVLFVLGGPGAGKGTQCDLLSSEFGMIHLSAGELLRIEREAGSPNGKLIESYLKEGKIVPVQITLDLLKSAMQSSGNSRFLVDGFPRNWDNIKGWEACMSNVCQVDAVLFIECPQDVLEQRIINRGLTSGRSDDNIETARKRFSTYQESTLPILSHYETSNKLIRVGGDRMKEVVFDELKTKVMPYICGDLNSLQQYMSHLVTTKNWSEYSKLCDPLIETRVNEQLNGSIKGLDLHKTLYFDKQSGNTINSNLKVEVSKQKATTRNQLAVDASGRSSTSHSFSETRSWRIIDGNWKLSKYECASV